MRSFFFYCTTMYCLFFYFIFLRTLKRHCHWLTDQLIERDQGVALCSSASTGGGQDSLFPNTGSNQPPWPRPHSCASQSKRTGWQQNISRSSSVSLILSRLIWKCCVSGWELICSWVSRHQLRQSWHCEYSQLVLSSRHSAPPHPPPTKSRNLAQPETVALPPLETEGTHAASDICAVVHMVLVKCVWMPTSSYATKYRDVLESCLGALQCFFIYLRLLLYIF